MTDSPSQWQTSAAPSTLWVVGPAGPLLDGICRIGREIGHRMIAVGSDFEDSEAISDEPWAQGVEWVSAPPEEDAPRAVILLDGSRAGAATAGRQTGSSRIVQLESSSAEAAGAEAGGDAAESVVLEEPDESLPADQLAIALLRAALEPDHAGRLSAEEVTQLGDAMYIK